MRDDELLDLTITDAARHIRTKELSPVELTEAFLARIERLEPTLKTFITRTPELALEQARQAEQEIQAGTYRGPLHGIPVTVKDLFYTKGIRTTGGSRILKDFVPDFDAPAVERLYEAGAVLLGKSNLHEFAIGATTDNPHYGTCQNPWQLGSIPGGSSGGSASALAASLCLASLGSDTGGSVRLPAALCGIVGHKPTYGLVPRYGVLPESWSLDHVGPMARSAADTAIVLRTIAGRHPADPSSARSRLPDLRRGLLADLNGLRVGVPTNHYFDRVDAEVEQAVRVAIGQLEELGAALIDVQVPHAELSLTALFAVAWAEAANFHHEWITTRPEEYGPDLRDLLTESMLVLATDYLQGQRVRARIRRSFKRVFEQVDVVVSPTTPIAATPIGQVETVVNGRQESVLNLLAGLTCVANMTGEPACSVPCGFTSAGLPVGLMIHGPVFEDGLVLGVAHAYEQASGWSKRRPAI